MLGDFYPSGDEYELVYTATGRLIPPAGIPLQVGCVVNNVETLYNVHQAEQGRPVTQKFLSVCGAVRQAKSFWAPVGTPFRDLLARAGGATVEDYGVFVSGLMMGTLTFDPDDVVTKTTGGLIVLPRDHYLMTRRTRSQHALDATDDKGREVAKYLNSPETLLYTKGNVLFNLDKAKAEMRKNDFAVLVEGQMDCISVYMAGIRNVLAISGTAFTETQVRLLGRFTKRVIVNFDPDTAGATAAEKSIALLTEEDFDVKLVTLGGGLDPDRFVREQGIQAYGAALRGAKRHSDYLIDRARQLYPGQSAEAKVSAMNFLLPHIRRMAHPIRRNQFAEDAANKLGIDSALMRQELKRAAAQRLASVPAQRKETLTETERVLLRALVLPESDAARRLAARGLAENSAWIADLATADLLDTLANAPAPSNPLDSCIDG